MLDYSVCDYPANKITSGQNNPFLSQINPGATFSRKGLVSSALSTVPFGFQEVFSIQIGSTNVCNHPLSGLQFGTDLYFKAFTF